MLNGRKTEAWPVGIGVRQGASSSPLLFNLIPEMLSRRLANRTEGIKSGDKVINSLLYADDLILLAENAQDLQSLLDETETWADFYHLRINTSKTEYICFNG